MSILAGSGQRTELVLRRVARRNWSADAKERARVVLVCVLRSSASDDAEATTIAQVWGADGGRPVMLDEAVGVSMQRSNPIVITTATGERWTLGGVGCSCNVPPVLKGFNPLRSL